MEKDSLFSKNGGRNEGKQAVRDAATVILLRDRTEGPYEVFLMRRHRDQVFMGGAYVFPGGRLDDADADPELAACIGGFCAADAKRLLQETDLPEATALGLFVAAIRETFEEAGVLLARDAAEAWSIWPIRKRPPAFPPIVWNSMRNGSPWRSWSGGKGSSSLPIFSSPIPTGSPRRSNPGGLIPASFWRASRRGRFPSTTGWS